MDISLYVLNVTYPLVDDEFLEFAKGKSDILAIEEGYPDYIEQELRAILHKAELNARLQAKIPSGAWE